MVKYLVELSELLFKSLCFTEIRLASELVFMIPRSNQLRPKQQTNKQERNKNLAKSISTQRKSLKTKSLVHQCVSFYCILPVFILNTFDFVATGLKMVQGRPSNDIKVDCLS